MTETRTTEQPETENLDEHVARFLQEPMLEWEREMAIVALGKRTGELVRIAALVLLALVAVPGCMADDCSNAKPKTRIFQFNPITGAWRYDDRCTGQTREGIGQVTLDNHLWTITGPALLSTWDDRSRYGIASVFPVPGSEQWALNYCRFVITLGDVTHASSPETNLESNLTGETMNTNQTDETAAGACIAQLKERNPALYDRVEAELSGSRINTELQQNEADRFCELLDRYNAVDEVREVLSAVLEAWHEIETAEYADVKGDEFGSAYRDFVLEARKNQALVQLYLARILDNPTTPNVLREGIGHAITDTVNSSRFDVGSIPMLEAGALSPILADLCALQGVPKRPE